MKLANSKERDAINESPATIANSLESVVNSRRVRYDYLGNFEAYLGYCKATVI